MALNSSGKLSLGGPTIGESIQLETHSFGVNGGTATISLNDSYVRTLAGISSGTISFNNFYGKVMPTTSVLLSTPGSSGTWTVPPGVTSITVRYPVPTTITLSGGTPQYDGYGNYTGTTGPYTESTTMAYLRSTNLSVTPGQNISYSIGSFGTPALDLSGTNNYKAYDASTGRGSSSPANPSTFGSITTTKFDSRIEMHGGNVDANFWSTGPISKSSGGQYDSPSFFPPWSGGTAPIEGPWTGGQKNGNGRYAPNTYTNQGYLQPSAQGAGINWYVNSQTNHGDLTGFLSLKPIPSELINILFPTGTWDVSKASVYWSWITGSNGGINPARLYNTGRNGSSGDWYYNYQANENGYSEGSCLHIIQFAMVSYFQIQY